MSIPTPTSKDIHTLIECISKSSISSISSKSSKSSINKDVKKTNDNQAQIVTNEKNKKPAGYKSINASSINMV